MTLSAQSVTLDGRRLDLSTQMFALFRLLIEQSVKRDPVLKKQDIERQTGRPANEIARVLRNALISSGMPEAQAEIDAEEQARLIDERIATKLDIAEVKAELVLVKWIVTTVLALALANFAKQFF